MTQQAQLDELLRRLDDPQVYRDGMLQRVAAGEAVMNGALMLARPAAVGASGFDDQYRRT